MSTRTYKDAIDALNSLQTNAAVLSAWKASGARAANNTIPEWIEYLGRVGYKPDDLNKLNVLHVTGTKGKGSTCAFADAILRHVHPEWKIGLYTSPHLVAVRERIRLNGVPISEEDFAKYFFEVWDRLEANDTRATPEITTSKPGYFRYLTLVAFHYFMSTGVDATILEVGVGGMYDITNVVPRPVVTGVTALGLDHTAVLGKTISEIAWQKGGIYKEGVPAFTVEQPTEGAVMLASRAKELKASSFTTIQEIGDLKHLKLGLQGDHQRQNASIAVSLTHHFLLATEERGPDALPPSLYPTPLPKEYQLGLCEAKWPGRCQEVSDPSRGNVRWFLDGAHTFESLTYSAEWFFSPGRGYELPSAPRSTKVLVFNCTSGRSGEKFLGTILSGLKVQNVKHYQAVDATPPGFFDHVIFCTNITYSDGKFKGDLTSKAIDINDTDLLKTQRELREAWKELVPTFSPENIHVLPSIQDAVGVVDQLSNLQQAGSKVDVFVAGSLHLVGGVIEVAGLADAALAT